MTTHEPVPRLQLSGPGDVAQLVPYLLGFVPQDSLVLLVTRGGRVEVTARADLTDVQPTGQAEHLIDRIWGRFPDADAFLVAYTDSPEQGWGILRRCTEHLPAAADSQSMLISADTWHGEDGTSGPVDRAGSIAAQAVYAGMSVSRSRADLEATFTSPDHSQELDKALSAAAARLPATTDTAKIVARTRSLLGQYLAAANSVEDRPAVIRMPVEDAAQLAMLGRSSAGRDTALLSITRANAERHFEMWRAVVNRVPDSYAEAAAYLAGMAAWVTGDGAAANVALNRSLRIAERAGAEPLAGLLDGLIDHVVPPTAWEQVRAQALTLTHPEVRHAIRGTHAPDWERVTPPPARPTLQRPGEAPPAPGIGI